MFVYKGSLQNKFSVKVWNLAQGGSDPIPTFINHCFYGIFDPFLSKISEKITEKSQRFFLFFFLGGGLNPYQDGLGHLGSGK